MYSVQCSSVQCTLLHCRPPSANPTGGLHSANPTAYITTRWLRTDLAEHSGASVIEVDMPSGWYVRKETLRQYQRRPGYAPAMRSHLTKEKVIWYLDSVSEAIARAEPCWNV